MTRRTAWTVAALVAGMFWVACGQGIYTYDRLADGSAGPVDLSSDVGTPSDALAPDGPIADASDGRVTVAEGPLVEPPGVEPPGAEPPGAEPPGAEPPVQDASPDATAIVEAGNPSTTVTVDWQGGEVALGDGRLVIPKDVLANPDQITLTQLSADGSLPGYGGALGPVFSITKREVFQRPARFELKITLDPTIPVARLTLAYIDPNAHLWLIIPDSTYDSSTGILSAVVNEFSGTWIVGPLLRCNAPGECGSPTACQGGVCQ